MGVRGHTPQKIVDKNGVIWGVPKYVITNLKINNFKEKMNKKTELPYFSLRSIFDEHVSAKKIRLEFTRGSGRKNC